MEIIEAVGVSIQARTQYLIIELQCHLPGTALAEDAVKAGPRTSETAWTVQS